MQSCQLLGARKVFYAVVDRNLHWRVSDKKYIRWLPAKTCEDIVKHETKDNYKLVVKEKRLSVFMTASHAYVILRLNEARPEFVRKPTIRYDFERKIIKRLPVLQITAGIALAAFGGYKLMKLKKEEQRKKKLAEEQREKKLVEEKKKLAEAQKKLVEEQKEKKLEEEQREKKLVEEKKKFAEAQKKLAEEQREKKLAEEKKKFPEEIELTKAQKDPTFRRHVKNSFARERLIVMAPLNSQQRKLHQANFNSKVDLSEVCKWYQKTSTQLREYDIAEDLIPIFSENADRIDQMLRFTWTPCDAKPDMSHFDFGDKEDYGVSFKKQMSELENNLFMISPKEIDAQFQVIGIDEDVRVFLTKPPKYTIHIIWNSPNPCLGISHYEKETTQSAKVALMTIYDTFKKNVCDPFFSDESLITYVINSKVLMHYEDRYVPSPGLLHDPSMHNIVYSWFDGRASLLKQLYVWYKSVILVAMENNTNLVLLEKPENFHDSFAILKTLLDEFEGTTVQIHINETDPKNRNALSMIQIQDEIKHIVMKNIPPGQSALIQDGDKSYALEWDGKIATVYPDDEKTKDIVKSAYVRIMKSHNQWSDKKIIRQVLILCRYMKIHKKSHNLSWTGHGLCVGEQFEIKCNDAIDEIVYIDDQLVDATGSLFLDVVALTFQEMSKYSSNAITIHKESLRLSPEWHLNELVKLNNVHDVKVEYINLDLCPEPGTFQGYVFLLQKYLFDRSSSRKVNYYDHVISGDEDVIRNLAKEINMLYGSTVKIGPVFSNEFFEDIAHYSKMALLWQALSDPIKTDIRSNSQKARLMIQGKDPPQQTVETPVHKPNTKRGKDPLQQTVETPVYKPDTQRVKDPLQQKSRLPDTGRRNAKQIRKKVETPVYKPDTGRRNLNRWCSDCEMKTDLRFCPGCSDATSIITGTEAQAKR
jgi:hypothetical protein